ncbi:Protein EARLY STARVATION 1, chloroplastic [Orobanche gracilis]
MRGCSTRIRDQVIGSLLYLSLLLQWKVGMEFVTFTSRSRFASKPEKFFSRCTRNSDPQPRDSPPKRDTGIANEKNWGISLLNENVNKSGTNEDGSTWYRESGDDLGDNGYRCRWTRMGGQSADSTSEWKERWWEKSDWTGYKELGVEKSGKNVEGDSWWETWREVLHQDEWRFWL